MKHFFTFLFLLPALCWAQNQPITITSISTSTVCGGSQMTVTYTSTGNFYNGAQVILDGTTIGSDPNAGQSATLTATIPGNLPTGTYTVTIQRIAIPQPGGTGFGVVSLPSPPFTVYNTPPPTLVTPDNSYCLNDAAVSLASSVSATGPVTWYPFFPQPGGPLYQAPTPPTSTTGLQEYQVSQTLNGCESFPKALVQVVVTRCNVTDGTQAGGTTTSGSLNTYVGAKTGLTNTTGSYNTLLGAYANVQSANLTNAVAIGANAKVAVSNAIVLGDPTNTSIAVGIGTDSPMYPLDVRGTINIRGNGKLKFASLTNPSLRNGTTDQFLTVNEQGETVLATYRLRIDSANQWSDKVFSPGYSLKTTLSGRAAYSPAWPFT